MGRVFRYICWGALLVTVFARVSFAQKPLSWEEVRQRFEANNPTLRAGQLGIDESKANEITAYLRPNPQANVGVDQIGDPTKAPFRQAVLLASINYLHERRHKRELRLESAQKANWHSGVGPGRFGANPDL